MQDWGINVLFKGTNFLRLLGGLWVTVRISLISVLLSIVLGTLFGMFIVVPQKKKKRTQSIMRLSPEL